ncbi:hypothetical protein H8B08_00405 [Caulobacter sp. 17J80-11]|nr:hypothetical protein [Caulobacter sp. 17J80-11]
MQEALRSGAERVEMIDELITQGAARTGLSEAQVRATLAGALGLLRKHAARDKLDLLFASVPGAEALATSPAGQMKSGGGLFGGLMKSAGGVSGAAMADAMGMLDRLKRDGVERSHLKVLMPVAQDWVRARSGRDLLRETLESVPGVGALLAGR